MTFETVRFGFGKNKSGVTQPAIYKYMLSLQRELRGIMIERVDFPVQLPSFGRMANLAAYFKIGPVRGILDPPRNNCNHDG